MKASANVPRFRLVYVEWQDHSGADGWMPLTAARRDESFTACTIGWLIGETPQRVTLAASITAVCEQKLEPDVAGHMTIHRALITKMRTVKL